MLRSALLIYLAAATAFAAEPDAATQRWWAHVKFLADDKLEGRDTGSAGYKKAAAYVIDQLSSAGVQPAGEKGFYQTVPLREVKFVDGQPSVTLQINGKTSPVVLGWDARAATRGPAPAVKDAPLYFVGTATSFEGMDLKGKIAVYLNTQGRADRTRGLSAAGAVGSISIANPRVIEPAHWPTGFRLMMAADDANPPAAGQLNLGWNSDRTAVLFEGTGHNLNELLDLALAGKPVPHFPLVPKLTSAPLEVKPLEGDNLIGILPGSDPVLAKEILVVSAHLDGYGIGAPVGNDKIYNGAFDDAACVAQLIEFAKHIKESGQRPKRTLVFAVYTGEEKGLLGSAYFTKHLTVDKSRIVANINLDYIRPIFPLKALTALGLGESTLGDSAAAVGKTMDIDIRKDMEPERNLFTRSDQVNFIRMGIPGIAFVFGYDKGSPEEATYRAWYADRYHKPSDDIYQPIDFHAAARFSAFFEKLALAVANSPEKPSWKPGSPYAK